MKQSTKVKLFAYLIGFLLLFVAADFLIAYRTVQPTEYALDYNNFTKEIDDSRFYGNGRHRIGWFHSFIKFPATQQFIEFKSSDGDDISGRTQDGLALSLDISFYWQLEKDTVIDIYYDYGACDLDRNSAITNPDACAYVQAFSKQARDLLRDVSSLYSAIEFFNNRTSIGFDMESQLYDLFTEIGVVVPSLQLRNIDLPDSFELALEDVEVARQQIEVARQEQQAAIIRAETAVIEAQAAANVTLIEANATAQAFLIQINAQAEALNITLTQQAESYYALSQELNFTSTELLSYLWIMALMEIGEYGNLIIIGENTPEIILDQSEATNSTDSGG